MIALELCYDYYIKWGYEPSLDFVKDLYKQDKISMMTKQGLLIRLLTYKYYRKRLENGNKKSTYLKK